MCALRSGRRFVTGISCQVVLPVRRQATSTELIGSCAAPAMCPVAMSNVAVPIGNVPTDDACRSTCAVSTGITAQDGPVRQKSDAGAGTPCADRNVTSVSVEVDRKDPVQRRVTVPTTR